jgi:ribose transport system substrate-binding protein
MPSESPNPKTRYIVKSVVHASAILGSFRSPGEVLRLRDIVSRSGLGKGMCFRLLYTMHDCGLLEKVGENEYRILFPLGAQHRFRIGYAGQDRSSSFCRQLLDGLVRACQTAQFELIVAANHHNLKAAVRNADSLIREHVDLAVMYEGSAPEVAAKFQNAGVPILAIDIPYPGATYFGADNHLAGLMGGRCLGQYAAQHWQGAVDEILLLEIVRSGPVVRTRVEGIMDGIKDFFPAASKCRVVRLDTQGEFGPALECVRKYLRGSPPRRVLIGAANDSSALGALRAFQECGRSEYCTVVGEGGEPEARAEMRESGTRLIGSVAFFPERYGEAIVRIATDILLGKNTTSAAYTIHQLVTPENVNRLYPNDALFVQLAREYD